jgi:hypothetical protein
MSVPLFLIKVDCVYLPPSIIVCFQPDGLGFLGYEGVPLGLFTSCSTQFIALTGPTPVYLVYNTRRVCLAYPKTRRSGPVRKFAYAVA